MLYIYITSLILFLVGFTIKSGNSLFLFLGLILLGLNNQHAVSVSDLLWYRTKYTEIDIDNIWGFVIENDYEFLYFAAMLLEKQYLGIGLHAVTLVLLLVPFLFNSFRGNGRLVSLFFLTPGSFLLFNNVIRQGFSEYFILYSMLSGVSSCWLLAFGAHRFSALIFFLDRFVTSKNKLILLVAIEILAIWLSYSIMSEETVLAYSALEFSVISLLIKCLIFLLPILMCSIFGYKVDVKKSYAALSMISVVIAFLFVFGRMADRVSYYLVPLVIYICREPLVERAGLRYVLGLIYFCISMSLPFIDSHSEFFDIES